MVKPESAGGWGLDGVWSDDFHHELRRYLTGDHEGVFHDFRGSLDDLADDDQPGLALLRTLLGLPGVRPGHRPGRPGAAAVRLLHPEPRPHRQPGAWASGSTIRSTSPLTARRRPCCCAPPATPLLFMGQEWAASTPFLFFTDHEPELGEKVRHGRRHEFRHHPSSRDPAQAARIPDCQNPDTFLRLQAGLVRGLRRRPRGHAPLLPAPAPSARRRAGAAHRTAAAPATAGPSSDEAIVARPRRRTRDRRCSWSPGFEARGPSPRRNTRLGHHPAGRSGTSS